MSIPSALTQWKQEFRIHYNYITKAAVKGYLVAAFILSIVYGSDGYL